MKRKGKAGAVVLGYVVKAKINGAIRPVSRVYTNKLAAELFVIAASDIYPDAYATEKMGHDDLTHEPPA